MKKILAFALVLTMILAFAACAGNNDGQTTTAPTTTAPTTTVPTTEPTTTPTTTPIVTFDPTAKDEGTMTYAEYMAAEIDDPVVVECFVQGHQSWWDNKITVYAQDPDGAYFMYEMACAEADKDKLVPGTKIKVTGYKATYKGEIEIMDCTFEIMEGTWIAEPTDVTDLLGTDDLINHQNKLSVFKGLTFKSLEYKQDEYDKDIYVTFTKGDNEYSFCVENYLTGPDTEVYKTVAALNEGDVVDVTGFLYWYEGINTHITAVTVVE